MGSQTKMKATLCVIVIIVKLLSTVQTEDVSMHDLINEILKHIENEDQVKNNQKSNTEEEGKTFVKDSNIINIKPLEESKVQYSEDFKNTNNKEEFYSAKKNHKIKILPEENTFRSGRPDDFFDFESSPAHDDYFISRQAAENNFNYPEIINGINEQFPIKSQQKPNNFPYKTYYTSDPNIPMFRSPSFTPQGNSPFNNIKTILFIKKLIAENTKSNAENDMRDGYENLYPNLIRNNFIPPTRRLFVSSPITLPRIRMMGGNLGSNLWSRKYITPMRDLMKNRCIRCLN